MFVTEDFIYIHVPKTGGTFVTTVLKELYTKTNRFHYDTHGHDKYCSIADCKKQKEVLLTSIRNPFDYYVSHYKMGWWRENSNQFCYIPDVLKKYPDFPELNFHQFVKFYNEFSYVDLDMNDVKDDTMGFYTKSLLDQLSYMPFGKIKQHPDYNAYFASHFLYRNLYSYDLLFDHIKCEDLNYELHRFLCNYFKKEDIDFILEREKIYPLNNKTREDNDDYKKYYEGDEELLEYVKEKERMVFEYFEYETEIF